MQNTQAHFKYEALCILSLVQRKEMSTVNLCKANFFNTKIHFTGIIRAELHKVHFDHESLSTNH